MISGRLFLISKQEKFLTILAPATFFGSGVIPIFWYLAPETPLINL